MVLKESIIWKICGNELDMERKNGKKLKKCSTELCSSNKIGIKSFNLIEVFSSNIIDQIQLIFTNHFQIMTFYRGILIFYNFLSTINQGID
jgi:hypothetical protein